MKGEITTFLPLGKTRGIVLLLVDPANYCYLGKKKTQNLPKKAPW